MVGEFRRNRIWEGWLVSLAIVIAASTVGADVRWNLSGPVGAGQRATLELVFEGSKPRGEVELPVVDGLTVLGAPSKSSSTQMSFATGQGADMRSTVTLGFPIRTERQGTLTVPRFKVETDKGVVEVPGVSIVVGDATLSGKGQEPAVRVADIAAAQVRSSNSRPYAGELFDLDLVVSVAEGRRGELLGSPAWNDDDAIAEAWSEGRGVRVGRRSGMRFQTRAVMESPGDVVLGPVEQEIAIETGKRRDPFGGAFDRMGSFFGRPEMARVLVASEPIALSVEPLPSPEPDGFLGAVGEFRMKSKVIPENPKAGEPLTWTLSLEGTGNWPMGVALPARSVSQQLRTIRPQIERDFAEGDLFTGRLVEDLVLIPEQAGEIVLDPVRFVYFDPSTGQYETLEVPARRLAVSPGRNLASAPALVSPLEQVAEDRASAVAAVSKDSLPGSGPKALPADLLLGSETSRSPVATRWVVTGAGVPVLGLLGYAFVLGIRRARVTDPLRAQREALDQALEVVDQIRSETDKTTRSGLLLDWQAAVGVLLGLGRAAPTPRELKKLDFVDLSPRDESGAEDWVRLWQESDYALYSSDQELRPDWCDRAQAQLSRRERPRFNPLRALYPRNILPTVTALCLLFVGAGGIHAEESIDSLYREGAFTEAAEALRERADAQPADWVARYNLGLVEAQLGNDGGALAETAAAFVHAPQNAAVRWNLEWLAQRANSQAGSIVVDARLRDLALGSGRGAVARLATPWTWQILAGSGVVLLCLGVGWLLRGRHQGGTRRRWIASTTVAAGLSIMALSALSLAAYGPLGDPDVAMVSTNGVLRSVPTQAQSAQAQRPIAAGTVVVQGGKFLGWVRVSLPSGESGWLRAGSVTPLYGDPSA